jgi:hypothetical protein
MFPALLVAALAASGSPAARPADFSVAVTNTGSMSGVNVDVRCSATECSFSRTGTMNKRAAKVPTAAQMDTLYAAVMAQHPEKLTSTPKIAAMDDGWGGSLTIVAGGVTWAVDTGSSSELDKKSQAGVEAIEGALMALQGELKLLP